MGGLDDAPPKANPSTAPALKTKNNTPAPSPSNLENKPNKTADIRKTPKDPAITQPIDWSASTLKVSNSDGTIELTSDVVVIQGGLKLNSNKAFIYFLPTREVDRIELLGDVKVVKVADAASDTRMSAQSDKAFFNNRSQTVVLQGRASLNRIQDEVRGEIITYELNTGWITVKKVEGVVGAGTKGNEAIPTTVVKKGEKQKSTKATPSPAPATKKSTKNSLKKDNIEKTNVPPPVETIGGSRSTENGAKP